MTPERERDLWNILVTPDGKGRAAKLYALRELQGYYEDQGRGRALDEMMNNAVEASRK